MEQECFFKITIFSRSTLCMLTISNNSLFIKVNMKTTQTEKNAYAIIKYYNEHGTNRIKTFDHFRDQGLIPRSIYRVIKRWNDNQRVSYKWNYSRGRSVITNTALKNIKKKFVNKPLISGRKVALEMNISEKCTKSKKGVAYQNKEKESSTTIQEQSTISMQNKCLEIISTTDCL